MERYRIEYAIFEKLKHDKLECEIKFSDEIVKYKKEISKLEREKEIKLKEFDKLIEIKNQELLDIEFKQMKCFVSYKKLFITKIDKILFDTMGVYKNLIEAKSNSNFDTKKSKNGHHTINIDNNSYEFYLINNENTTNIKKNFHINDKSKIIGFYRNSVDYANYAIIMAKNENNTFIIYYDIRFKCEDVMDIIDKLIRTYKHSIKYF
jgi:hypothetical protein